MAFNPFDPALFAVGAPCLPCCTNPVGPCPCALILPLFSSPYSDYAHAATVINDAHQVVDCYGYFFNSFGGTITSLSVDVSVANQVTWDTARSTPSEFGQYINVTLKAGDTLTLNFSGTMYSPASPLDVPSVSFVVYDCTGTQVHSDVILDTASGTMTWTVSADGTYYVLIFWGACVGTPACGWGTGTSVLTSANLVPNPVIALWDDSGTTRQLEACPKLYLPTLTEMSGNWYSDCAEAALVISGKVVDCLAYFETTFATASASGTAPFVITVSTSSGVNAFIPWASFNCAAGDVLTFSYSSTPASVVAIAYIYDDTGTLVQMLGPASSPLVSSSLPYTGRYIVRMLMIVGGPSITTASWSVSSSGTLGVNPVQALYDIGLDCPARLNCGDSCP